MIALITTIALLVLVIASVCIICCGYQPPTPPNPRPRCRPRPGSKENP